MLIKLKNSFFNTDTQSRQIRFNTILTFFFRGGGILCSFLIVPLTLNYLDQSTYGVWLTLSSIVSWLSFMDIGLGNGLRNKLAEAIAKNDKKTAKEYTSTTYILFSVIILAVILAFAIVNQYLDWNSILKIDIASDKLLVLTYVIVITFCLRLVLELAGIIVIALQTPFIKAMIDFLINAISLLCVLALVRFTTPSLITFGTAICIIPLIVLLIFSFCIFKRRSSFSYLAPSTRYFKRAHIKSLFSLGFQFFIIQLAALIIFSTDNILITQVFSPVEVTSFNVAYKYFSILTFGFTIVLLPYWSAFTTAYIKKDIVWIKGAFRKLLILWVLQLLAVVALVFFANDVYKIWVGPEVVIPASVNILLGVYVFLYNWNNIFAYFLNGVSKIKLQLYSAIFIGLINIPVAYYLATETELGVAAIVLSNCICLFIVSIWSPVQCYKIINDQANGIWNK